MSTVLQRRRGVASDRGEATDIEHQQSGSPMNDGTTRNGFASPKNQTTCTNADGCYDQSSPRRRRRRKQTSQFFQCRQPTTLVITVPLGLISLLFLLVYYHKDRLLLASLFGRTTARIPVAKVDVAVPSARDWPLIHIVSTRFMQEQGSLEMLGMARFHLFMTFCFPTMVAQSTQKFIWIIKVDPRFTQTSVFSLMLEAVRDHPNVYIVASNRNFFGFWRDGTEPLDLIQSPIYSGNMHKLQQAMALREERIVLETRLDADDGLHQYYLQYMQYVALSRFKGLSIKRKESKKKKTNKVDKEVQDEGEEEDDYDAGSEYDQQEDEQDVAEKEGEELEVEEDRATEANEERKKDIPQWLYWCTRRHLEWHSALRDDTSKLTDHSLGLLAPLQHEKLCITPGITVGYNVGADPNDVPMPEHDKLFLKVNGSSACYSSLTDSEEGDNNNSSNEMSRGPCLELVDDFIFCALRSRTWTSAGMQRVPLDPTALPPPELTDKLWLFLKERFNMNQTRVRVTQDFLIRNQKEIAYENLLGQCTTGHSCKQQAKKELTTYIERDDKK